MNQVTASFSVIKVIRLDKTKNAEWLSAFIVLKGAGYDGIATQEATWALVKASAGLVVGEVDLTCAGRISVDRKSGRLKVVVESIARRAAA
ncbi:MAG: hypothetical protein NTZ90_10790 [Proteobacteria bacterium]|nr:hypothetical protein [Pseudomonadota bacterium]